MYWNYNNWYHNNQPHHCCRNTCVESKANVVWITVVCRKWTLEVCWCWPHIDPVVNLPREAVLWCVLYEAGVLWYYSRDCLSRLSCNWVVVGGVVSTLLQLHCDTLPAQYWWLSSSRITWPLQSNFNFIWSKHWTKQEYKFRRNPKNCLLQPLLLNYESAETLNISRFSIAKAILK